MPKETRVIDCAWTKPNAPAVKAARYDAVIGYISHDPSKDLTAAQAANYVAHDVGAGFVFESTASRAGQGYAAGITDAKYAIREAKRRGYPKGCALFFAVDFDAAPDHVEPYFRGVADQAAKRGYRRYKVGPYGGIRVVAYIDEHVPGCTVFWQTAAWSAGKLSKAAHIYQRVTKKGKAIAGVTRSSYDENVICRPVTLWGADLQPGGAKVHRPTKHPKPDKPTPHHHKKKRTPPQLVAWILRTRAKAVAGAVVTAVLGYFHQAYVAHNAITLAGVKEAVAGAIVTFLTVHTVANQDE